MGLVLTGTEGREGRSKGTEMEGEGISRSQGEWNKHCGRAVVPRVLMIDVERRRHCALPHSPLLVSVQWTVLSVYRSDLI